MVPADGGGEIGLDRLARCDHAVLQAVVLPPARIPPEQVGPGALPLIGAPHTVQRIHAPRANLGVGILAAAGMEIDGVMPQSQLQIVRPGGANRADGPYTLYALIHPQHSGNPTLGQALINDIRLGLPQLRQGGLEVVEHDCHRPPVHPLLRDGHPGQRIPGPLVFRRFDRLDLGWLVGGGPCGIGRRRRGPLRLRARAGRQSQQQRQTERQQFLSHVRSSIA